MIRARSEIINHGDVEMSITITMRVKDWKQLCEQLSEKYPSWSFGSVVSNTISNRLGALTDEINEESP